MALDTIPQEILEHIAFFTATESVLGPPSALIPLLQLNQTINNRLSISSNQHLYARIFTTKFDIGAAQGRLGADVLTPQTLTHELIQRCVDLKRIRARLDSTRRNVSGEEYNAILDGLLFRAYLMMLEDEGKNEMQLREYAQMGKWLREFWFHEYGSSYAIRGIRAGEWPPNTTRASLAMWLFWFLLKPDEYPNNNDGPEAPINVLKIQALAAHIYNLTTLSWAEYVPRLPFKRPVAVNYYSESMFLSPPPLAIPAILSFLALVNKKRSIPLAPSDPMIRLKSKNEWDAEWGRCVITGGKKNTTLVDCFMPGSFEGVWEGFFTYTEFTAYAALLGGAPPQIIQKSVVGRHQQTWKLREHHLIITEPSSAVNVDPVAPLLPGDPLRSYFPTGTQLKEHREGLLVQEPGRKEPLIYRKAFPMGSKDTDERQAVQDIIITGEGHSAWGQFNLVGRVRPYDGFISLSKDYVDSDRGKWLYRGYLVGNTHGNFAGRWRDTLSSVLHPGYEGTFAMSRRR